MITVELVAIAAEEILVAIILVIVAAAIAIAEVEEIAAVEANGNIYHDEKENGK